MQSVYLWQNVIDASRHIQHRKYVRNLKNDLDKNRVTIDRVKFHFIHFSRGTRAALRASISWNRFRPDLLSDIFCTRVGSQLSARLACTSPCRRSNSRAPRCAHPDNCCSRISASDWHLHRRARERQLRKQNEMSVNRCDQFHTRTHSHPIPTVIPELEKGDRFQQNLSIQHNHSVWYTQSVTLQNLLGPPFSRVHRIGTIVAIRS